MILNHCLKKKEQLGKFFDIEKDQKINQKKMKLLILKIFWKD